jgi:hypothetical protein
MEIPCQVWGYTLVISALGRLRQEDVKFKASLGYRAKLCLKNKNLSRQKKKTTFNKYLLKEEVTDF